jgi:hypothetical protein
MADSLPVFIQMGSLPISVSWTPQMLADAMVARMRLVTAQTFALFVAGSTEPASNVGPWLKNGTEWWVWSDTAGAYVPITVPAESLGYFIGDVAPDQNTTNFWIETTAGGSPLALKIYYSGAWTDVYATTLAAYQTIAAFNTAIAAYAPLASPTLTGTPASPTAAPGTNTTQIATTAFVQAAVGGVPAAVSGTRNFKARESVDQDIVFGGAGNMTGVVNFGTEDFDPDGLFAADTYVPGADGYYTFKSEASVEVQAGAPTAVKVKIIFLKNSAGSGDGLNSPSGLLTFDEISLTGSCDLSLVAADQIQVGYDITVDAACTIRINGATFSGYRTK